MSDTDSTTSMPFPRSHGRNHSRNNVTFSASPDSMTSPSEGSGSTIKQRQHREYLSSALSRSKFLPMPAPPSHKPSYSLLAKKDLSTANVFGIIHRIRRDIKKCIETALTYEQLNSPKLVFGVVRPLQDAYLKLDSPCTIYALLLNRVYFDSQQYTLSSLSVNNTRAMLCEILAVKVLRALYEEDTSENGVFRLAILLASTFSPFQGAPEWAIPLELDMTTQQNDRKISTSALELAIVSEAKRFIRAVPTQKVIMDIWRGKIVYSSLSFRYLIKDQYKRRPIMKYDVRTAPLLDHYRLRVPRIRAALEWTHFAILFVAYLVVLRTMEKHTMNGYEIFWVIYAFGFALDKFASLLELGWTVFTSNLWNGLDFIFIIMFIVYLPLRIIGLQTDHDTAATEALSILTCAGCILFPRFAFTTLSDNLLILSLRSMLAQFSRLMVLAVWCFAGFWVAFVTLGGGQFDGLEIIQWMIWIWFGLDATGLVMANQLHNVLGPILMVIYACLSSTLLLTVLVSILSNTFNQINRDAIAEQMYRRAVSTFQGVKSDGIFSFQPPINILALTLLWPARFLVTPHKYHQIIVLAARISNLPLLLIIHFVERHFLFVDWNERPTWLRPSSWHRLDFFGGARTELASVFEYEEDIDDDSLPGGAFDIHDGVMTPAPVEHEDGQKQLGGGGGNTPVTAEPRERKKSSSSTIISPASASSDQDTERGGRGETVENTKRMASEARDRSRQRRTQSMSDWGGTISTSFASPTRRSRPTILSKLYGYGTLPDEPTSGGSYRSGRGGGSSRLSSLFLNNRNDEDDDDRLDEEDEDDEAKEVVKSLKERLERIEEGQKRIEEALRGLGGGAD